MIRIIRGILNKIGFDLVKYTPFPEDFEESDIQIVQKVRQYTMTSPERIYALVKGLQYIVKSGIPGDIVECGVWRGGSIMAAAIALISMSDKSRDLYLFDTFEGMSKPSESDISYKGEMASELLKRISKDEETYIWAYTPIEKVKDNLLSVGYDFSRIHFIKGKVEDTIPGNAPGKIALLRLDTDWYESTLHELIHLYPRISPGGIIIIDDYGHWKGAKKAVDEFIQNNNIKLFLGRTDYSGRIGVKQ